MPSRLPLVFTCCLGFANHGAYARTWTEAASGRKIEAEYVSSTPATVTVSMGAGKNVTIDLSRLSAEDRAFVQQKNKPAAGKVKDRFTDVPKLSAEKIPASGEVNPVLVPVDNAVRQFMVAKGVPAVAIALSRHGKILYDRAFGWADASLSSPLHTGVKMHVASMTKPVVAAAVTTLFTDQKLKPDDLIFDVLNLSQYSEAKGCDPRWKKVTIQHLLDHKGGWDRAKSGDFTGSSQAMGTLFRVKINELDPVHVVRFGLKQPMDFDPGDRYAYCNFGYVLLVRAIEKASGQKFIDYLHSTICKTAEAPSFSASASDARDRQEGEIWYCYHPEYPRHEVPLPFRTEATDGAGILACTAADYCRFLEAYWINGKPREPGYVYIYNFAGSLPGVTAICSQRKDGINYAAIANRRGSAAAEWNDELRKLIDAALDPVAAELK